MSHPQLLMIINSNSSLHPSGLHLGLSHNCFDTDSKRNTDVKISITRLAESLAIGRLQIHGVAIGTNRSPYQRVKNSKIDGFGEIEGIELRNAPFQIS